MFPSQAQAQPLFSKIATGDLVNTPSHHWNACWGDYDSDGDLDVFVAARYNESTGGTNLFYRNNGDGTFTRLATNEVGTIAGDVGRTSLGLWVDEDRDGDLDFVLNERSQPRLYRNNGQGRFSRATAAGLTSATSALGFAAGDYDNDGWIDFALGTGNPQTGALGTLLHNSGSGTYTGVAFPWRLGHEQYVSWSDYDDDGDLDLAVSSYYPPTINQYAFIRIYTNNGVGVFGVLLTVEPAKSGQPAWGDYDNDGDMDLLVGRGPENIFLRNDRLPDGSCQLTRLTHHVLATNMGICPTWGDYDNDGWLDLFVTRGLETGNPGLLFHNHGDGTFNQVTNESLVTERMRSFGACWVDYDNDGSLDLFICNGGTQAEANRLFRNNGNTNHWLKLLLKGTSSNTDAVGAKVRLQARIGGTTFWQLREIGDLWVDRRAHFGLGDATNASLVRIEWPSGIVQELRDVPANQILTVTEPVRLQLAGPGQFRFRGWRGQVCIVEASADLTAWNPIAHVTNLTGTVEFVDADARVSVQRFYRLRSP